MTFGCTTTVMFSSSVMSGSGPAGRLPRAEYGLKIAAAEAVHEVVAYGETAFSITPAASMMCCIVVPWRSDRRDRVERRLGGLMQVAVERCRIGADRERAQHLTRIVPPVARIARRTRRRPLCTVRGEGCCGGT